MRSLRSLCLCVGVSLFPFSVCICMFMGHVPDTNKYNTIQQQKQQKLALNEIAFQSMADHARVCSLFSYIHVTLTLTR